MIDCGVQSSYRGDFSTCDGSQYLCWRYAVSPRAVLADECCNDGRLWAVLNQPSYQQYTYCYPCMSECEYNEQPFNCLVPYNYPGSGLCYPPDCIDVAYSLSCPSVSAGFCAFETHIITQTEQSQTTASYNEVHGDLGFIANAVMVSFGMSVADYIGTSVSVSITIDQTVYVLMGPGSIYCQYQLMILGDYENYCFGPFEISEHVSGGTANYICDTGTTPLPNCGNTLCGPKSSGADFSLIGSVALVVIAVSECFFSFV
eukprot:c8312_g1_i1.p1 GENE.c8312_g1_i1~~c8312_g1_i1.p1  ORF type:complete len:259 (-),score=19.96 c8312_g1_i1:36-812(-)